MAPFLAIYSKWHFLTLKSGSSTLILNHIGKLNAMANVLLDFVDELKKFKDLSLEQVKNENMELYQMLIDGLCLHGSGFSPGSPASLLKKAFGIYVSDPRDCAARLQAGLKLDKILVKVDDEKADFLRFVNKVHEVTSKILQIASDLEVIKTKIDWTIWNPKSLFVFSQLNIFLREFLSMCVEATVTRNLLVRLIWALRKTTIEFIKMLIPSCESQIEEIMKLFGLEEFINICGHKIYAYPDFCTKFWRYKFGCYYDGAHHYIIILVNGLSYACDVEYKLNELYRTYFPSYWNYKSAPGHIEVALEEIGSERWKEIKTIGGGICILNELIWHFLHRKIQYLLIEFFPEIRDPYREYLQTFDINAINGTLDRTLGIHTIDYVYKKMLFETFYRGKHIDKMRSLYNLLPEECAIKIVDNTTRYIKIATLLDIIPLIATGGIEFIIDKDTYKQIWFIKRYP